MEIFIGIMLVIVLIAIISSIVVNTGYVYILKVISHYKG